MLRLFVVGDMHCILRILRAYFLYLFYTKKIFWFLLFFVRRILFLNVFWLGIGKEGGGGVEVVKFN